MRPGDEGGGAGAGGAPAARMEGMDSESAARLQEEPDLVLQDVQRAGNDGGGVFGMPATTASAVDSYNHHEFPGLEEYVNLLQPADEFMHCQMGSNLDWPIPYDEDGQDEGFVEDESDSDSYDDFLVRCEGDTDVEDCFPIQITRQEVVVEEERPRIESKSKNAKEKAELTRAAKRRVIEGAFEEDGMAFSDQPSDDCRELSDSSDDDGAVDEERVSVTKRKSRAKKQAKRTYYDESNANAHELLEVKMCFEDVHQFRRALTNYHIVKQRDFEYLRNDHDRITVCCKIGGTCPFAIMSSTMKGETTHVIRGIVLPHTCGKTNDSSRINSVWLSKTYEDQIRSEPNMKIQAFIDMVMREYGVSISKHMAYRAKKKALEVIDGHHESQYLRIRDYLQTVLITNPGSRCIVNTIVNPDPKKNPRFHGLFYCLNAQVQGFLEGCRPFIGVDGCFLKVGSGFQILAATARDGNNNMFPLAFGVVGKEETATWCWFLSQLRYALGGGTGKHGTFTIMSDRQKGLLNAVSQVFPECDQRFCLRHIYANFQLAGFRGDDLKKLVDAAAYAYNYSVHIHAMNMLKALNLAAWTWLSKIPTKHWARHAMIWQVEASTNGNKDIYAVNLRDKTCGCRKWDLTGVPCKHAISVIYKSRQYPEDFISDFFKKPMYAQAYKEMIYPVPGQHDWVKTDTIDIEPPIFHNKPGRKKKKRRPSAGEGTDGTRKTAAITCSNCKLKGHRYTTCTQPLKPHLAIRKAGHKSNRQLPEYMDAPVDPVPPPAAIPPPAPPRQVPFSPPRQAAAAPRQPPAQPQQAAAVPGQPPARPQQPAAAPRQPSEPPRQSAGAPRQPPAPPQQDAAAPLQPPAAPRQKLHSVRGRGRRKHYTKMPVYSYFTASNGQGTAGG